MTLKLNAHSATLPAGRYLIIDPCDSLPDGEWDKAIDDTDCFNEVCYFKYTKKDGTTGVVVAFATAEGGGCFNDLDGNEYGVDAGVIGILPADEVVDEDILEGGHIHEFSTPFRCYRTGDTIIFGHVEINTGSQGDEGEGEDMDNDY